MKVVKSNLNIWRSLSPTLLLQILLLAIIFITSPKVFAIAKTYSIPTELIERGYKRHPQTGDIYVDLIEVLKKLNLQLEGRELISIQFIAKSEEISASDIFLALNGRIENSVLLVRRDNDSLLPRSLTPLDRSPVKQAALVFRGQSSLSQLSITFDVGSLP